MEHTEVVLYLFSYGQPEITKKTFPTVLENVKSLGGSAQLVVHDCSEGEDRLAVRQYFDGMKKQFDCTTIYTDNIPLGLVRNAVIDLGIKRWNPVCICTIENDHGLRPGALPLLLAAMQKKYDALAPNNFRFGMFTLCGIDNAGGRHPGVLHHDPEIGQYQCAPWDVSPLFIGRCNACMRAMPVRHWQNVVNPGYDVDEYYTSEWQTNQANMRNYHHGYTTMVVGDGTLCYEVPNEGRGTSTTGLRVYDTRFCRQDRRSQFIGKENRGEQNAD